MYTLIAYKPSSKDYPSDLVIVDCDETQLLNNWLAKLIGNHHLKTANQNIYSIFIYKDGVKIIVNSYCAWISEEHENALELQRIAIRLLENIESQFEEKIKAIKRKELEDKLIDIIVETIENHTVYSCNELINIANAVIPYSNEDQRKILEDYKKLCWGDP